MSTELVHEFLRSEAGRFLLMELQDSVFKQQGSVLASMRNKNCMLDQIRYEMGLADGIQYVVDWLEKKRMGAT